METISLFIIVVSCVVAFFLNTRNLDEKLLAVIYVIVGFAVMYIPMGFCGQIGWGVFVMFCIGSSMCDGSINSKKSPRKAIGIMMCSLIPVRIVFIDWCGLNMGWILLIIVAYWCYEYINAIRK